MGLTYIIIRYDRNRLVQGGVFMKKLIRKLIKYGPIIYPVIKKYLNKRKTKNSYDKE